MPTADRRQLIVYLSGSWMFLSALATPFVLFGAYAAFHRAGWEASVLLLLLWATTHLTANLVFAWARQNREPTVIMGTATGAPLTFVFIWGAGAILARAVDLPAFPPVLLAALLAIPAAWLIQLPLVAVAPHVPFASQTTECPECGYNLHGLPEPACPECGWNRA